MGHLWKVKLTGIIYKLFISIYRILPFKKLVASTIRALGIPTSRIYKDLRFRGVFKVKSEGTNGFLMRHHYHTTIENEIFWNGLGVSWESRTLETWMKLARDSEVILDIGANTGIFSLTAAMMNPTASVYAFEPVSDTFHKLDSNIRLNNFNILPFQVAVSNTSGVQEIIDFDLPHQTSASLHPQMSKDRPWLATRKETVKTMTLAEFIRENGIDHIDLIKIDVEMYEPQVLEGMGKYLSAMKPDIVIEILNEDIGSKVQELVMECEYNFFGLPDKGEVFRTESLFHPDCNNYLLTSKKFQNP